MNIYPAFLAITVGAVLAFSSAAAQTVPPPPNDNFANAMVLTGQAVSSTPVNVASATREGLERSDTENQTVWYSWVAPQDGIVTITTAGTNYNNHLAVFNGSTLANLVAIVEADGGYTASVTFHVKAGFDYFISIGLGDNGYFPGETAVLNINNKPTTITAPSVVAAPAGGNDNFANAVALPGATVSGFTYPAEASREGQEPSYTGNNTVWWTWTAPTDVEVTVDTAGIEYNCDLNVFYGTSLSDLTLIRSTQGRYTASINFPAKAGSLFYICIGAQNGTAADSIVNVTTAPLGITAPVVYGVLPGSANDDFANAFALTEPDVSSFGYDGDATRETLEPSGTGSQTLWWTWTAPADAEVTMTTTGSDLGTAMAIYNGDSLNTLHFVGFDDDSVSFPAKAGFVYHISIGDRYNSGEALSPVLNITTAPLAVTSPVVVGSLAAANDNFANAQDLGNNPVVTGFGYNDDATVEQNESSSYGYKTLWWTWTAPSDGILNVDTFGTDIDPVLTVATGNSLTTLGAAEGVGTVATPATGKFNVSGGTVYHFAVASRNSDQGGRLFLNLNFTVGIPHVTLVANSSAVRASQTNTATFTVNRDGDLSKKLVVNVKVKYLFGSGSRTIKATKKIKPGHSSATLNVSFSGFPYYYGSGTVKVFITPATGYLPATPYKAKTQVEDN